MRYGCGLLALVLLAPAAGAHGLLIPKEKTIPPLAMLRHEVTIAIDEQVAVTKVEQAFRNHTQRDLEATYIFPLPRGASVQQFSMRLNGKDVKGELVEAGKAKAIYSEAVARTLEPGLLEYIGNEVMQLRVFPVPAGKDVNVTLTFNAVLARDAGMVEYVYPLKTNGRATSTLEAFSIKATITSQHGVQNIYSPTHALTVFRDSDRAARIVFQEQQALLDKDFCLLYAPGQRDVGLTTLVHRPGGASKGHFMLLLAPRAELAKDQVQPRDLVLVLDVSGSMSGQAIVQAKKAVQFVLDRLAPQDRFGIVAFADGVNTFGAKLWDSTPANVAKANRWVDALSAAGGTNINDALLAALGMRPDETSRTFTIAFFTDGQPTVGETNPQKILANVLDKNTSNTRFFTFGVRHDVNAALLDQLALKTRGASVYVRPGEDIEAKVSSFFNKFSHPVLVDLRLTTAPDVILEEMYPPKLPDLFHGEQVVVLGRYTGEGSAKVTLHGSLNGKHQAFDYEVAFAEKTDTAHAMIEGIWARRKIGFLLDQVRVNGEQKELVEAIVALAKQHGIATPYTSYLIVPEAPLPVVNFGQATLNPVPSAPQPQPAGVKPIPASKPGPALKPANAKANFGNPMQGRAGLSGQFGDLGQTGGSGQLGGLGSGQLGGLGQFGSFGQFGASGGYGGSHNSPSTSASSMSGGAGQSGPRGMGLPFGGGQFGQFGYGQAGQFGQSGQMGQGGNMGVAQWAQMAQGQRGQVELGRFSNLGQQSKVDGVLQVAKQAMQSYDQANAALKNKQHAHTQVGQLGVDLSVQSNHLRGQSRIALSALRKAAGRGLLDIGGAWIDEEFKADMPTFTIRAASPAYFRLLECRPELSELFQLGNHLVWVTPSGRALVIDLENGHEELGAAALDALFRRAADWHARGDRF